MDVRRITVTAASLALALAIALLYLKVSRSASTEVDPAELAKAASEYRSGAGAAPAPAPRPPRPPSRAETVARLAVERPSPTPEPDEPVRTSIPASVALPADHAQEPVTEPAEDETPYEDRRLAANKLYDRRRFPESRTAALALLEERPDDKRMIRVVVSASCIMYEPDVAREYFQKLPERDKQAMRTRCARYEVDSLD